MSEIMYGLHDSTNLKSSIEEILVYEFESMPVEQHPEFVEVYEYKRLDIKEFEDKKN